MWKKSEKFPANQHLAGHLRIYIVDLSSNVLEQEKLTMAVWNNEIVFVPGWLFALIFSDSNNDQWQYCNYNIK